MHALSGTLQKTRAQAHLIGNYIACLLPITERIVGAGVCLGLAAHWRLYPIIYGLPILRHLATQPGTHGALGGLLSRQGLVFGLSAAATFAMLGVAGWAAYGHTFLQETYLYHLGRVDPRHNFSPYFLPAYLSSATLRRDIGW